MGGLDGYMARTANWVVVCETTCKETNQSEITHGNGDSGIDRPVPNDPFLPHSQLSAEGVSFSEPFHQGADVGLRVQGRECVGHRPQVVVGGRDTAEASIRDSWSFSSVAWGEATGGWQWRTCLMPGASLKSNANRSQPKPTLCSAHRRPS
jgi:hypothetical protein